MSYPNPLATQIPIIGLDGTITSLQTAMGALTWLSKCFHRAYRHTELNTGNNRAQIIPKTWQAGNEWINVLPNDNQPAQAFFWPLNAEEVVNDYDIHVEPLMEADICLIVWVNTSKLAGHTTGPSLANQKADVLAILNASDLVVRIDGIVDRSANEIFEPFTINDDRTQYTMLPYQGFRINFRVKFTYSLCLTASS